jgi:hypothetical protein
MVRLKNNEICASNAEQLCELHNNRKSILTISKAGDFVKTYHPLKRKKIKSHRLRFVPDVICMPNCHSMGNATTDDTAANKAVEPDILSRKYTVTPFYKHKKQNMWSTEDDVIDWLLSIGVHVKRVSLQRYVLMNRACFLNSVVVFANRKRIEMGLEPFYFRGITES